MVHKPITRVSLALEGLEFVEVNFAKESKRLATTV